jgi:XisH protein
MPAKDRYHNAVRQALESDGWTITDDPLPLRVGTRDLYIDLGAERLLAAERGSEKIAVEIKTFGGVSPIASLEQALGQFVLYSEALELLEPERLLFLAVPESVQEFLAEPIGQLLLDKGRLRVLILSVEKERILEWLPEKS